MQFSLIIYCINTEIQYLIFAELGRTQKYYLLRSFTCYSYKKMVKCLIIFLMALDGLLYMYTYVKKNTYACLVNFKYVSISINQYM